MCGIAGYLRLRPDNAAPISADVAREMLAAIRRRGPDGEGQWRSADDLCWLGHRRLAIIDLHTGDQPMCNEDGTVQTVFNGEIYNYRALRTELEARGHRFKTRSDTEVLVHGYEEWGLRGLAERLQGIFAFAIYDVVRRSLSLVRDPMGVKPLYWWSDGNALLFASEMKSLLRHPALRNRKVNRAGVAQVLVTRYVSRPDTMFEGVSRLPEGCFLEFGVHGGLPAAPQRYWDVRFQPEPFGLDDAVEQLDGLLKRTVDMQLISDVPLGVQLSGGVDSSIVVALMETLRRERGDAARVKTFSVGFDIAEFSELGYARQVADRYGTEHHEITVGFKDFAEELPLLAWIYDEPMGEPPGIPTYFMCREAKKHVTVMLCGEGADELFGGYSKYAFDQFSAALDWLPSGLRRHLLRGVASRLPFEGRRLRSMAEILAIADLPGRFASWYGGFDTDLQTRVLSSSLRAEVGDGGLARAFGGFVNACDSHNALDRFLYCDMHTRLVDDILVKGDRMSMGAGIEARVPFLDHKVVEFAARLPSHLKVSGLRSKIVLKQLAERYIPHETIYRRKVGFTVPLTRWFAGPWRGLINDVLLSDRCLGRGYYNADVVRGIVRDHVERRVDREQGIWLLLCMEIWHRLFVDDDGSESAVARLKIDFARSFDTMGGRPAWSHFAHAGVSPATSSPADFSRTL
ncbi:MAG: asparagine synthase (glutamine-hydrolyzing) [Prolixibacteraceae bacterium]|nr:asparagine synthase (glutamine-hydrolyzing) [Burkholderiales bacterium]